MTPRELVGSERARLRTAGTITAIAAAVAVAAVLLASGALILADSRWLELPRVTPFLVWTAVAAGAGGILAFAVRWWSSNGTIGSIAARIEAEQRLRNGELRSALEVDAGGPFGRLATRRLGERLSNSGAPTLAPSLHGTAKRRLRLAVGASLSATALLAIVAPLAADGVDAVLSPARAWGGTLLPPLSFTALPAVTIRGEPLVVRVAAPGRTRLSIDYRVTGERWRTVDATVDRATGSATVDLGAMRADLTVVASDGRTSSDTASVAVTDRPFAAVTAVRAIFPAYLGRTPETIDWRNELRIPRGTRLELSGRASLELTAVTATNGIDSIRLAAEGHGFTGAFTPTASAAWELVASGRSGRISDVPPPMHVEIVPDAAPRITLISPEGDSLVAADDRIGLRFSAEDDHGVAFVGVRAEVHRRSGRADPLVVTPVAAERSPLVGGLAPMNLGALRLLPGDRVTLSMVVRDNSPWAQQGESRRIVLRIPTIEERRTQARSLGDSLAGEAAEIAAAQQQLARRTEDAARAQDRSMETPAEAGSASNSEGGTMSYEASERAKAAAQAQQELADRVEQLRDAAGSLERQLQAAGVMDERLAEQLAEAQRLLRDAMSPELTDRMRRLQEAAARLDARESRDALRDLAEQQRRLREQLERSAEMLKRAALEGAMQTLAEEAKDIAGREREMASREAERRSAQSAGDQAQQRADAEQRRELADRTRRYEQEAGEVAQRLAAENANAGAEGAEQSRSHAERSRQQLSSDAARAAESMDNAAEAMQRARESQVGEWKEELSGELDRAIQEMLQLAREERELESRVRAGEGTPEELRGRQGSLQQGVDRTAERLNDAARRSSLLSARSQQAVREAQQKAENATRRMGDPRQRAGASQALGDAAEAMARAAASLARDRERVNSASSASGFAEMIQQLQQMAQRQGSIASQAQGLLSMPLEQRSGEAGQGSARALARQQRSLSRQLEELGDQVGGQRAAELGREARQLAELLERGRLDAETVARQQQLFRRMLDAGRSLEKEEREETDRREARTAVDGDRHDPGAGEVRGREGRRYREPTWEELRGLSPEERRAIQEYFRRINDRP